MELDDARTIGVNTKRMKVETGKTLFGQSETYVCAKLPNNHISTLVLMVSTFKSLPADKL